MTIWEDSLPLTNYRMDRAHSVVSRTTDGAIAQGCGTRLTDCEKDVARQTFSASDPFGSGLILAGLAASFVAGENYEAANGGPQDNNPVNARKHCIWACELSKRFDEETSRKWTDAHECGSTTDSSNMDYHNNWIGRLLGNEARTQQGDCKTLCEQTQVTVGPANVTPGKLFAIKP